MEFRPHAPFDSPLGQLQRGTGSGYLSALADPASGRENVLDCLAGDPRHDPQTECRAGYFAQLTAALGIGAGEVVECVGSPEDVGGDPPLSVEVLAEMAVRGDDEAASLLEGRDQELALAMLSALRIRPGWCAFRAPLALVEAFAEQFEPEDLVDDVEIHGPFWHAWRDRIPTVEQAFVEAAAQAAAEAAVAPTPIADPGALGIEALIQQVELGGSEAAAEELARRVTPVERQRLADCVVEGASMRLARIAAGVLGRAGDGALLERADAAFRAEDDLADPARRLSALERMRRAVYMHYVRTLPPDLTLGRARDWWQAGGFARTAGATVLARAAEPADRGWLEGHVREVLGKTSGWTVVSEIEALGTIGDPGSVPLLCEAAARVGIGVARVAALGSLVACGSHLPAAGEVLEMALWDGEAQAREIGCRHAPPTPRARARREALAADRVEDEGVVQAARAALDR